MTTRIGTGVGGWAVIALAVLSVWAGVAFVRFMLPTDDVPRDPDAVVVLGGAGDERARLGIELAERYGAQLVLSSNARFFAAAQGQSCEVDAICFEPIPENTVGEARNVAALAEEYGWEHVTVATSDFHTSRTRFLFRQCLGDRVTVVGASRDDRPRIAPRLLLREAAGVIAGATIERAC
jgi:uncharacterized SAM-binding protein YcdF (DUF218 family)